MPDPDTARPDRRKPAVPEHADPTLVPPRSEPGEGRLADPREGPAAAESVRGDVEDDASIPRPDSVRAGL